ncbi:MAG: hypothetical protein WBA82_02465 [Castellaniella sp.]|jgi:hypothetical protein
MPRTFVYFLRPAAIDAAKPKEKPYPLTDGGGVEEGVQAVRAKKSRP